MSRIERTVVDPGWAWDDRYSLSPAIRCDGLIYVSGQLALDHEGQLVGRGDMAEQSRRIFANIAEILAADGAGLTDILRMTCYVTDLSQYGAFSKVRSELFPLAPPASTTIGASALLIPGALLEIDAIAIARH